MVKPKSLSKKLNLKTAAARAPVARPVAVPKPASEAGTEKIILGAARKEFIAKGKDGARMQAIAVRAGVNKALLHYYYRSKDRLYQAVLQDIVESVWSRIHDEFEARGKPEGLEPILQTLVSTYVRTLAANPEFPLFVFRDIAAGGKAFPPLLNQTLARFQNVPAGLFRALQAETKAGRARPVHPLHFFMNLMGMCVITFLARPMVEKMNLLGIQGGFGPDFLEERIRAITDMALHGIRTKKR